MQTAKEVNLKNIMLAKEGKYKNYVLSGSIYLKL